MDFERLFNSKRRFLVLKALAETEGTVTLAGLAASGIPVDRAGLLRELRELGRLGAVVSTTGKNGAEYRLSDTEETRALARFILTQGNKTAWTLLEEMPNGYNPCHTRALVDAPGHSEYFDGLNLGFDTKKLHAIFIREGKASFIYLNFKDYDDFAERIAKKTLREPQAFIKWLERMVEKSGELRRFSATMKKANFSKANDKELAAWLGEGDRTMFKGHMYMWIQTIDASKKGWTPRLIKLLKGKQPDAADSEIQAAFASLTTPTDDSLSRKETQSMIGLVKEARQNKALKDAFGCEPSHLEESLRDFPKYLKKVDRHTADFGFLTYGPTGPGNSRRDYLEMISMMLKDKTPQMPENKPDLEKIEASYNFTPTEKAVFEFMRRNVWYKGYRKDCMLEWWMQADRLFSEIARRRNLSFTQIRMTAPWEFSKMPDAEELDKRKKTMVMYNDAGEPKILSGQEAEDFKKSLTLIRPIVADVDEFYGNCACSGVARGKVRIINTREDMAKMEKGDILVSCATSPELMPAINKAGAIITDMGGITCHAAIVSRELGIPCVIGTGIATKALKDGEVVEVNANHGRIIRLLKGPNQARKQ